MEHATDVRSTAVVNEACINWDNQSNLDCLTTDCNSEFKCQIRETLEQVINAYVVKNAEIERVSSVMNSNVEIRLDVCGQISDCEMASSGFSPNGRDKIWIF